MTGIITSIQRVKGRIATAALWVGLLAAAWSLPVLDRIQAAEEHERMTSGYYYTPQRPAADYAVTADAE